MQSNLINPQLCQKLTTYAVTNELKKGSKQFAHLG
jgi:hypothetical protein